MWRIAQRTIAYQRDLQHARRPEIHRSVSLSPEAGAREREILDRALRTWESAPLGLRFAPRGLRLQAERRSPE